MSPTDYLRLLVVCLWLLDGDVHCENMQTGYVFHVQAEQAPVAVHDDGGHKRWRKPHILRIPTAGYKLDRRQSIHPAQEELITNSKSSVIHTSSSHAPKSQINHFKSAVNSASLTRGRSTVVYNRSGNKAFASPVGKKIHGANSDSVFTTDVGQVPTRVNHPRTKLTGDKAAVGYEQNNRQALSSQHVKFSLKSDFHGSHVNPSRPNVHPRHPQESRLAASPNLTGYHPAHDVPSSFNHDRANLRNLLRPRDKKTDPIMSGYFSGSVSAGKVDTQMSYPAFGPRLYSGRVKAESRGYTHVRHLKPGFEKTRHQATGFPPVKQIQGSSSHDSTKHGFGVPASSERQLRQHPSPPPSVQGKFKPFQRLPPIDLPAQGNSSDGDMAPTQTSAGTTIPPSLNSTSSVQPNASASTTGTESGNVEIVPQASTHEGQSESPEEVGPSFEQSKPYTFSPSKQPAEKQEKDDKVVESPPETDLSDI